MTYSNDKSAKDAPLLSMLLAISIIVIGPIALFLIMTQWSDSVARQVVAGAGIVVILIFSFMREKLYALIIGLIFVSQFSISLHSIQLSEPALLQIFFIDFILILLVWTLIERGERWRFDKIAIIFSTLIVWQIFSTIYSAHVNQSQLYILWQVKYLVVYLVFSNIVLNEKVMHKIFIACIVAVGVQALIALIQFLHGGVIGISILGEPSGDSLYFVKNSLRVFGTLGGANSLAGYLAMLLVFLVPYVILRKNLLLYSVFGLGSLTLLLSFSRSGWLSLFMGGVIVIYQLIRLKRLKFTRIILIGTISSFVFMIMAMVFMDRITDRFEGRQAKSSAETRITFAIQAWDVINKYPLFGIGPGVSEYFGRWNDNSKYLKEALPDVHLENQVHNGHLQIWMESGTVGFILWMVLVVFIIFESLIKRDNRCNGSTLQLMQVGSVAASLAIMLHVTFGTEINNYRIMILFWVFLGLSRNLNIESPTIDDNKTAKYKEVQENKVGKKYESVVYIGRDRN